MYVMFAYKSCHMCMIYVERKYVGNVGNVVITVGGVVSGSIPYGDVR